jgi:hypothetical protein
MTRDAVTQLLDRAMREAVQKRQAEEGRLAAEREAYADELVDEDKDAAS